jgi:hypothetical protein
LSLVTAGERVQASPGRHVRAPEPEPVQPPGPQLRRVQWTKREALGANSEGGRGRLSGATGACCAGVPRGALHVYRVAGEARGAHLLAVDNRVRRRHCARNRAAVVQHREDSTNDVKHPATRAHASQLGQKPDTLHCAVQGGKPPLTPPKPLPQPLSMHHTWSAFRDRSVSEVRGPTNRLVQFGRMWCVCKCVSGLQN